ncbi:Tetratricopeptide-like helical [Cynara cardunculus var. scolymus]|uniref:Tetratricopeptide-like helical n=1 Tax=Cynara cardunculus var. scolymus TaxID=59895 RepID=A0A103XIL4_CYNCS|nr:Tetratricopeptide-like helical [Cynara cardunculus var. scolymus]
MNGGVCVIRILNPHPLPPSAATTSTLNHRIKPIYANAAETNEIRVCTNRTCRRQGSMESLQVLSGIAPPNITVNSCGCLGRCGAGPNLVILPSATFVSHCATAARAAEIMAIVTGFDLGSWNKSLEALSIRKKAEVHMEKGDFATAEILLSQALDLNPVGGIHHIYRHRSVARLAMNNTIAALGDAIEASTLAPKNPQVAGDSYSMALELDPSIRRSKSFKARIAKLEEKLLILDL